MSRRNSPSTPESAGYAERQPRYGLRRVMAATALAVTGIAVGPHVAKHMPEIDNPLSAESHGTQRIEVNPGDTLHDLIKDNVEGGANHVGQVATEAKQDPDNAQVFENDQLDPGEVLELPEKID